jgi:hypothetical protein
LAHTKISFATGNLININLPGLPVYLDRDDWDEYAYNKKIAWSGFIIRDMPVEVWGFQQLWHYKSLEDILLFSGLSQHYNLLVPTAHDGGHIVWAAAVWRDLLVGEPEWVVNFPKKYNVNCEGDDTHASGISVAIDNFFCPILYFKILPRSLGRTISVYLVHFKSKLPTDVFREKWYRDDNEYYSRHRGLTGYALSTIRRIVEAIALVCSLLKSRPRPIDIDDNNRDSRVNTSNLHLSEGLFCSGLSGKLVEPNMTVGTSLGLA